jgi:glycine/D-amino acid oxidase-like deaminating enzyme
VITDRAPGLIRHQVVELGYVKRAHDVGTDSVAFNVQPRATGQVLVGSSRQIDVTSPAVEPKLLETMLARCFDYLPRLATVPAIRAWTGLRAATPDGLPLVGPWPAIAGLWLATGHEGLGITTAPATAEGLVAGLLGRDAVVDPAPWLPARFRAVPAEAAR